MLKDCIENYVSYIKKILITMSSTREPLFSSKNIKLLTTPLGRENPITVQVLGICSALAVTVKMQPAFVMAVSVIAVLAVGNVVISLLRKTIAPRIRIIVQLVVAAALVILVDQILKALFMISANNFRYLWD